jgi:hypothetical protein
VWKILFDDRLKDRVSFSYVKGSGIKQWDSLIDYVPIISDIDIHIGTRDYQPLFPNNREGFLYSLETTKLYEKNFLKIRPNYVHIPRPQIVFIEEHQTLLLPEKTDDILPLHGDIPFREEESEIECKKRDLDSLREIRGVLDRLPMRVIDRVGLEYFRIIRELCWIVSPTPIRVLSQLLDSKKVWKLNRTDIVNVLENVGLGALAEAYTSYYMKGWEAFDTRFTDNQTMRELITLAYDVLELSFETLSDIVECAV